MTQNQWSMSARTTVRPGPDGHTQLIQQGIALHNARRFREAERCYQLVLRDNPKHPDALNLMGVLAVEADRFTIAIDYLRKAVAINPRQAIYQNNLGNALFVHSFPEEAIPHLKKAVQLDPKYAEAMCNLGRAYRTIGDAEKARRWFEKALKADAGFLRAKAGLAELAVELGQTEEATEAFRKILALDPWQIEALWGIALARKFEESDPEIQAIEQVLRDPTLRSDQRAPLHHALGKIYNDIGRWEDALGQFIQGKKNKAMKFYMELHRRTYANLRSTFSKTFFAARPGYGHNDERPVFIVGMPRSGTTLTEQILASHPRVHGLGELPDFRKIGQELNYGRPEPEAFSAAVEVMKPKQALKLAERYLRVMKRVPKGAARATDKNPHNYEMLGLIAILFPNAKIVHCRRDAMDTCVSCFMQNFNDSHGYNSDLTVLGQYYREYSALMDHWRDVLPLKFFELNYEDMVADQEGMSRKLIDFVGLEWDDACFDFFNTERTVATPSRWQVRQPIYTTSVKRWKRYEAHLGPLKEALGDLFVE